MPCPLFLPALPLGGFAPDALPLGDLYGGECVADRGALIPMDTLRGCCNHGYARGTCERAASVEADAARFLIRAHSDGLTEVAWALEANHHPLAVGTIFVNASAGGEAIHFQARAYVSSYLRRTGQV